MPSWYLLDGVTGLQVAWSHNPVNGVGTVDQQEETAYAVSTPVPSRAIWNFLDNQDWLKFVVGRSTVDREVLTRTMTKV